MAIYPVIMCGGAGTRLWPASRPRKPKQFIALASSRTLFQDTVLRVAALAGTEGGLVIVAGTAHERLIREQLAEIGVSAHLILEPEGRDSAPAMTAAALWTKAMDADGINVFVSSDHYLPNAEAFRAAALTACEAAAGGRIVTLGVKPSAPSTAYGYIQAAGEGLSEVVQFVEKPDVDRALDFIAKGYVWNTGIFVTRASVLLDEVMAHTPAVLDTVRAALPAASGSRSVLGDVFAQSPRISIDYAVMENTRRASVLKVDFDWSDLGAWDAVANSAGHVHDRHVLIDSPGSHVRAPDDVVVSVVGAAELAVVVERDAVLVCALDRSQDVKKVVERVREISPAHLDFLAPDTDLFVEGRKFLSWMKLQVLPLWSTLGCRPDGFFHEELDFQGEPVSCEHRIRVQARQMFVFAEAGRLGWRGPWKEILTNGYAAFQQYCCDESGGLYGLLSSRLEVVRQSASVYDNAFGIFAMAHAYRNGVQADASQAMALRLLTLLEGRAEANEAVRETDGYPCQSNSHMHLFEACLAWTAVSDDPRWVAACERYARLARTVFIDPAKGCLREYFASDWTPAAGEDGERIEPGHQFEWAWLLGRYAVLKNDDAVMAVARKLYEIGSRGLWREARVVVDAVDTDGRITQATARLWPQTEWLRAALFFAALSEGDIRAHYIADAETALTAVKRYLTDDGLWRDQLVSAYEFDDGNVRASSLYHLMGACSQMVETFRAMGVEVSL